MRVRSPLLLAALGAGGLLVLFAAAGIGERATVASPEGGIDESAMGRLIAWDAAIRMALAHPLTGVGPHLFPANFYFYTTQWLGKAIAAHSVWFEVLGETGFVGLILFVTMIGVVAGRLLRAERKLRERQAPAFARASAVSLLAALAGFAVSATFLSQAYGWPLYMIMAFAIAVTRYADGEAWLPATVIGAPAAGTAG
jgi:O-antigen ligase